MPNLERALPDRGGMRAHSSCSGRQQTRVSATDSPSTPLPYSLMPCWALLIVILSRHCPIKTTGALTTIHCCSAQLESRIFFLTSLYWLCVLTHRICPAGLSVHLSVRASSSARSRPKTGENNERKHDWILHIFCTALLAFSDDPCRRALDELQNVKVRQSHWQQMMIS